MNRWYDGGDYFLHHPPDLEPIDEPPPAGLAGFAKGLNMTTWDNIQQLVRIVMGWLSAFLVAKGIADEANAAILIGSLTGLTQFAWWWFWTRKKAA